MTTDTTRFDTAPLCACMLRFRDSFVAFCNRPTAEQLQNLEQTLEKIEEEARTLREQIERQRQEFTK